MYRNPVPKAEQCERCEENRATCLLMLTDLQGTLLDRKQVCAPCAKHDADLDSGKVAG